MSPHKRLIHQALLLSALVFAPIRLVFCQAATELATTTDGETITHESQWMQSIESDLVAEKFDDLDRMAEDYRRSEARLPGGAWRLRLFYEALDAPQQTDKDTADHLEHLHHWMTARPESITARVALATSLTRWAWVARGNGVAKTVTPEGWQLFNQRIGEAKTVLEGSRDMRHMCPQWYSEMMTVGLAQGWTERQVQENFNRGVQFAPDYYYLYRQYANYLLPKWYGKQADASNFARSSADRLGGDRGDMLYFQISTVLVKRGNGNFSVEGIDWPRIQRGYQLVTSQYGPSRRNTNDLAFMAYKFNDSTVARQQFAVIGDDWAQGVWRDRQFFDRIRDWSQAKNYWP